MPLIEVEHVEKQFPARRGPQPLMGRNGLLRLLRGRPEDTFKALKDVSFHVEKGESLGIIGANGSGKSTLLKIIAGVTTPSSGHVRVHGRIASLLELGAGFHPMLTGRENVYLNAGILGMRHAQVDEVFDRIVAFSGIGDFIDNPVDTYSSGMYVRIGFAVAAHVNPDIFLVDEVLAVGDEEFQRKCRRRLGELREEGKTLVFVSHDLGAVAAICDRVILLDKGRLLTRRTAQETIDFYLRQVGREKGVHHFGSGNLEAVFNHGRLSLFRNKQEISSPVGFNSSLQTMNQWQTSTVADWEITERDASGCTARGVMPRLPVALIWTLRFEGEKLHWTLRLEVDRSVTVEAYEANLHLPPQYTRWVHDEQTGAFPEILPSDLEWMTVVPPDASCTETAAIAPGNDAFPPVFVTTDHDLMPVAPRWTNADYATGSRILQVGGRVPEALRPLASGSHELMGLTIDLGQTDTAIAERTRKKVEKRQVHWGNVTAEFQNGAVLLYHGETLLTNFLHGYSSMLVGNLWHDSANLRWEHVTRTDGRLEVVGESRRLPFRQYWALQSTAEGLDLEIWLEAMEQLAVEEYQVSLVVRPEYSAWETAHERGEFPPIAEDAQDWAHLNRDYSPGKTIKALSSALPSVTFHTLASEFPFRMTAINTDFVHASRVLQALRIPERGRIVFSPGKHLYFRGRVCIEG